MDQPLPFEIPNVTVLLQPEEQVLEIPRHKVKNVKQLFMKTVPTTWDNTRFIDGYPGRYLIMARRHGDTCYIAGVNAADEPVKTYIEIPSEMRGQILTLYSDTDMLEGCATVAKPDKKGRVRVTIPRNGAFVLTNRTNQ